MEQGTPDILFADGSGDGCSYLCAHNRSDRQEYVVKVEVPQEKRFVSIDCATGTVIEFQMSSGKAA